MISFKENYQNKVAPAMREKFGYKNILAAPKIQKVVVNTGIGRFREDKQILEEIEKGLILICGQKPVKTLAKKAIAGFKIRQGSHVGYKTTLRGARMYDFLDRLIHLTLPRTKDFRGLKESAVDQHGNLTVGIKEHIVFPEISHENIRHIFSLEITVVSTAKNKEEGLAFFKLLGFPIKGSV